MKSGKKAKAKSKNDVKPDKKKEGGGSKPEKAQEGAICDYCNENLIEYR